MALHSDPSKGIHLSSTDATLLMEVEPAHVHQVFVASKLPTGSTSVSLKTAHDTYLSCDKFGVLSAERLAVGPQEEWVVIQRPDGFALQSAAFQTFLRAEDMGEAKRGTVRADSQESGFRECFQIKCQAGLLKERKRMEMEAEMKRKRAVRETAVSHEALLDERSKFKSDKFCK